MQTQHIEDCRTYWPRAQRIPGKDENLDDTEGDKSALQLDRIDDAIALTLAPLKSSDGGLYFGAGRYITATSFGLGLIDDVRIYNRAVSP